MSDDRAITELAAHVRALEPVAIVKCIEEAQIAFRERADALGISREVLDDRSGLQSGYSAKILSSPPSKDMGNLSFWTLLGALGLAIVLVEDKQRNVRFMSTETRIKTHPAFPHWRNAKALGMMLEMAKKAGSAGGKARAAKCSQAHLSRIGRAGARARWRKARAADRRSATAPASAESGSHHAHTGLPAGS